MVQLNDITNLTNATATASTLNANNEAVEAEFEKVVYRDGSKALTGNLDVNSKRLINIGAPQGATDAARLVDIQEGLELSTLAVPALTGNEGRVLKTDGTTVFWADEDEGIYLTPQMFGAVGDGVADDTVAIQQALDEAWLNQCWVHIPAGTYLVTGLTLPPVGSPEFRGGAFKLTGVGSGEVFTAEAYWAGTVIKSVSNAPILKFNQTLGPNTGSGNLYIEKLRFVGSSSTPVLDFDTFYIQSHLADVGVYQGGTGDGINVGFMGTAEMERVYVINGDWDTAVVPSRTGAGIRVKQDINCGLATFRKVSARGFRIAFAIGIDSLDVDVGAVSKSMAFEHCEASVVHYGWWIGTETENLSITGAYLEGVEKTCIIDKGAQTTVSDGEFLRGFQVGIDATYVAGDPYGSRYVGNYLETDGSQPCTLIKITSTGAFGGPGRTVMDNHLLFSTSGGTVPGVVGIEINGIDPRLNLLGNTFLPRGKWIGGAGTQKIKDLSTSSDGAVGSGIFGIGIAATSDEDEELVHVGKGSYGVFFDPNVITSLSSGVCALSGASGHTITLGAPANLTSFTAPNLPSKLIVIHTTNANCTFVNGANLKMLNSANYTPGANGAMLTFYVKGNVVYEASRTPY